MNLSINARSFGLIVLMVAMLGEILVPALAQARSHVDAVQLDNIALDASVDCTRTFFRSSRNFNGTIYVMPRVVPEKADDERQIFSVESDGKGGFVLALQLYFPRNEEQIEDEWNKRLNRDARCNFDVVKNELNKVEKDESQKVKRIAPIPLTSIEVIVPGARAVGRIGRSLETDQEVDILEYDGKSLPVEIPITADEKQAISRRMNRVDGLPVTVRFRFQARSRDGGVTAKIDWRQLSTDVQASLQGQRLVVRGALEVAIRTSLQKMSANITVDSGESPSFEKISGEVIAMILGRLRTDLPTGGAAAGAKDEKSARDDKGAPRAADADTKMIDVRVAVQAILAQGSSVVQYEQNGISESATAETVVNFRPKVSDPNLREVRVRAGFANSTLDEPILAGQTIKITPAYHFLAKFNFDARKARLTLSQIRELHLDEKFPDIATEQMVIENRQVGQQMMAVGKWVPLAGYSPLYSPGRYTWLRTERVREIAPSFAQAIAPELAELRKLPIAVGFSNFGGRFSARLDELIGEHPMWSAFYDPSGTIVLTAKKDLGLLTFLEKFRAGEESIVPGEKDLLFDDIVMDSVVEEQTSATGGTHLVGTPVVLKHDPITIMQSRYVVFNVSRPAYVPLSKRSVDILPPASTVLPPF